MPLRYWALLLFLGVVWGCSFLFNALLIRELSPLWVSAGRVTIGALGCWAFFLATRRRLPADSRLYPQLLLLGMINYAVPFALFPLAEQHLASGIVGVINAMTPMTTALVSQVWPGAERATWNKTAGALVGFAGASILAAPSLSGGGGAQAWAIVACLAATLCYAVTLNYARRFKAIDPTTIASCSLTGAALVMIPLALLAPMLVPGSPHAAGLDIPVITRPETWGALLAIGLVSTSLAFVLMYWLLPKVGATNFSITTFVTPVSAIVLGVAVLGERLEATHLLGAAVIFLGLVLIDGRLVRRLRRIPA
jgi:drug/metabolite transporter (DMT)-like permease